MLVSRRVQLFDSNTLALSTIFYPSPAERGHKISFQIYPADPDDTITFAATVLAAITEDVEMAEVAALNEKTKAYSSSISAEGIYTVDIAGFSSFAIDITSISGGTLTIDAIVY